MHSLRQKTWGIFIRPYIMFNGDRIIIRGNLLVQSPCAAYETSSQKTYSQVQDGQSWMLYKCEYLTSFPLVRERVKEIIDTLGYSKNDILVTEVVPVDTIVTPLT